jgi:hypothetical protein
MNNAHHVHLDGAVETELLGDARYFVGGKHDAETEKHIARKGHQPEKQQSCLHKCCQTDGRNLFAPLIKAVGIPSWYAEHIQASDCHLHEQDTAALDILEEHLDYAVGKSNHDRAG